jgi:hypothetical protein
VRRLEREAEGRALHETEHHPAHDDTGEPHDRSGHCALGRGDREQAEALAQDAAAQARAHRDPLEVPQGQGPAAHPRRPARQAGTPGRARPAAVGRRRRRVSGVRYLTGSWAKDPYDEQSHRDLIDILEVSGSYGPDRRARERYAEAMRELGL